jgi:hypothetical protein
MQALKPFFALLGALTVPTLTFAQDPSAPASSGWKRVGDPSAQTQTAQAQNSPDYASAGVPMQAPPPPPPGGANVNAPPSYRAPQNYPQQQQQQSYQSVPAMLTVPGGTYLTVRTNQMLSSDKNQAGDAFSASLLKPLVVNGVVVAEPGQTIGGRVVEAVKAGHIEGVARLGVQLTDLTLVDGQQLPIQSSLINRAGPTSIGQDAGTIAGTTALGAAIGAAADWGRGAAIGAGAGAAAGIIGVLVTRGHASVLYPEHVLTFRLEAPLTIATDRSPQAFRYVQPGEYDRPVYSQQPQQQSPGYYGGAAYPPPYYGNPYPYYAYGGYGYPYYWGPSFSLFVGPRYYGGYRYGGGRYYGGGGYTHFSGGGGRGGRR